VLAASATPEAAGPAEAMKKPMRPAPAATNVVVHARLKKVRIVVPFDYLTGLLFWCSCDSRRASWNNTANQEAKTSYRKEIAEGSSAPGFLRRPLEQTASVPMAE
jgi:hypothetical protein